MSQVTRSENFFVGYEYKNITVRRDMESVYMDGYPQFGWVLEGVAPALQGLTHVMLKFKRDRRIQNKTELTRLQHQFESYVKELERLETSKLVGASAAAYTIGIIGTAFLVGAVLSYLAAMTVLGVLLSIPGLVGWGIPYFLYLRMRDKKTDEVTPLIDQQYDAIYDVCEKANKLLA